MLLAGTEEIYDVLEAKLTDVPYSLSDREGGPHDRRLPHRRRDPRRHAITCLSDVQASMARDLEFSRRKPARHFAIRARDAVPESARGRDQAEHENHNYCPKNCRD